MDGLDTIPLFPLPNAVLFPHTTMRLHIFEPRYREMTERVLKDELPLAIGLLDATGELGDNRQPGVHPVVGVGQVTHHKRLQDGRFLIQVTGRTRLRVVEEVEVETPYRQIRGQALKDQVRRLDHARRLLGTIQNCLFKVHSENDDVVEVISNVFQVYDEPGVIADVLGAIIFSDTRNRQKLLAEVDVVARLEKLRGRLAEMMIAAFDLSDFRDAQVKN